MKFSRSAKSNHHMVVSNALTVCFLSTAIGMLAPVPSQASNTQDVMFIIDASNSMWGRVDGQPKIEIAKDVLLKTVSELPNGTRTGLISYGHRFDHKLKECSDIELIAPYQNFDPAGFGELLQYVTPKGQTPIAYTLQESIPWIAANGAKNPTVVLITDGVESCDGDPCAAASQLANSGIDAKVHVVGYDLGSTQRAQLECIAENTNGKYFEAKDTEGLRSVLREVTVAATAKEQPIIVEPVKAEVAPIPVREVYFEDEFDGSELGQAWTVNSPNQDNYIVENGELLMITSDVQSMRNENFSNLVVFTESMPEGDWDLTAHIKFEMQTGTETFWLGLYKDNQNYLSIALWGQLNEFCKEIKLSLVKNASGKETQFDSRLSGSKACGWGIDDVQQIKESIKTDGVELTLSKRGRSYSAHAKLPGTELNGEPAVFSTEKLTALRLPGLPTFGIAKWKNQSGETLATIDRLEIVKVGSNSVE